MNKTNPNFKISMLILLGIFTIIFVGTFIFKTDIILLLILSILYTAIIARLDGKKENNIIEYMTYGCSKAFCGLLFF